MENRKMNEESKNGYEVVECPNCKKEVTHIDGTDYICPYCGGDLKNENESKKNKVLNKIRGIRKRTLGTFLMILLVVLCGVGVVSAKQGEQIVALENQYAELQDSYESLSSNHDSLNNRYKELDQKYKESKAEIEKYKDQQATIDDLNKKLTELQDKYTALESERNNLQQQLEAKKAAEQAAAEQARQQQLQQQANQASTGSVCVTPTGECYHRSSCSTLRRSSTLTYMSESQAQASGYRACKVCNP